MHRPGNLLRRPVTGRQANIGGRSDQQGRGEGSQDYRGHIHPALDIAYPGESAAEGDAAQETQQDQRTQAHGSQFPQQFAQPAVVRHRVAFIAVTRRSHLCALLTTERPLPAGPGPKRPAVLTKTLVMEAVWPMDTVPGRGRPGRGRRLPAARELLTDAGRPG